MADANSIFFIIMCTASFLSIILQKGSDHAKAKERERVMDKGVIITLQHHNVATRNQGQ